MVDGLLQVEGGRPLSGEITVRGAKNLVSKAMVAALLGATPSVLRNVPLIRDVDVVSGLLALHGVAIDYDQAEGVLSLDPSRVETAHVADIDAHAGSSRIPIPFCGPLLHRAERAARAARPRPGRPLHRPWPPARRGPRLWRPRRAA